MPVWGTGFTFNDTASTCPAQLLLTTTNTSPPPPPPLQVEQLQHSTSTTTQTNASVWYLLTYLQLKQLFANRMHMIKQSIHRYVQNEKPTCSCSLAKLAAAARARVERLSANAGDWGTVTDAGFAGCTPCTFSHRPCKNQFIICPTAIAWL